jgi:hypothetical protein
VQIFLWRQNFEPVKWPSMFRNGFLVIVNILWLGFCAAPAEAFAPLRSFLPINSSLADALSKHFQISLQPGLYFTDQRTVLLDPGLLFEPATDFHFDATYLEQETFNELLFGERGWKSHAIAQLVWRANGELQIETLREFDLRAQWLTRPSQDALIDELWLARPNGEKWVVAFRDHKGDVVPNLLTPIPAFFQPLEEGALFVAKDFVLAQRWYDGRFSKQWKINGESLGFVIASQGTAHKRRVLLHYDSLHDGVFFAGRTENDTARATELARRPLAPGDPVHLFHLDVKTAQVKRLISDLRFPFSLTAEGVVRDRSGKKERLKWKPGGEVDGDWTPFTADVQIAPENLRKPLAAEDLAALRDLGYPNDLLSEMRSGREVPIAHDPELAHRLATILARPQDSLALLLYEEGQEPIEYVRSFFKSMDLQVVPAPASIASVQNVFHLPQNILLGSRSKGAFKDALERLKILCTDKNTVLFMEDFPFPGQVAPPTTGSKLVAALREWEAVFAPLVAEGKCRVIWSLRRKLYETLRETTPTAFGMGAVVQIPEPGPQLRREIARMTARRLELRYRLFLPNASFESVFAQVEKDREKPGARKTPGLYQTTFMDLFDALSGGDKPTATTPTLVDSESVQSFLTQRDGHWMLKLLPWQPEGEEARGEIPMWVKERSGHTQKANAIDPKQYKHWQEFPESLKSNPRFQHALFIDGESVQILVADHSTVRALDFIPVLYELHPRGFYFVRVDRVGELEKREATLGFFNLQTYLERYTEGMSGVPEGVVRILKAGMRAVDLNGKLAIRFVDDRAVIERDGAVLGSPQQAQAPRTYFGPEGELK